MGGFMGRILFPRRVTRSISPAVLIPTRDATSKTDSPNCPIDSRALNAIIETSTFRLKNLARRGPTLALFILEKLVDVLDYAETILRMK